MLHYNEVTGGLSINIPWWHLRPVHWRCWRPRRGLFCDMREGGERGDQRRADPGPQWPPLPAPPDHHGRSGHSVTQIGIQKCMSKNYVSKWPGIIIPLSARSSVSYRISLPYSVVHIRYRDKDRHGVYMLSFYLQQCLKVGHGDPITVHNLPIPMLCDKYFFCVLWWRIKPTIAHTTQALHIIYSNR